MQFMMQLAPITFPIAMLAGLGWCIGIALLEQSHGIGYALTQILPDDIRGTRPLADAKTHFLRDCQFRTQTGAHPACTPNASLGYEESLYWFRVLAFFDGKRSRMPKRPIRRK